MKKTYNDKHEKKETRNKIEKNIFYNFEPIAQDATTRIAIKEHTFYQKNRNSAKTF